MRVKIFPCSLNSPCTLSFLSDEVLAGTQPPYSNASKLEGGYSSSFWSQHPDISRQKLIFYELRDTQFAKKNTPTT